MTLGELLDELRNNILHDRSDQIDGPSDYLWSDEALIRYINQAYYRFARLALCLRDGTTPNLTTFKTIAGQDMYPLDPSIVAVISTKMAGDQADMARAGHDGFSAYHTPDTYFFDPGQLSNLPPGKPLAWGTDEYLSQSPTGSTSVVTMRLYPVPSADYAGLTVQMRVVREPVALLKEMSDIPELPAAHHLEMLDWAAYLALRIVDHDAGNVSRAQEFRQSFEDAAYKARLLALRKLFAPLQHGFGRNGWSWEGGGYGV